ncbi:uncharacterized protein B0J16DRAFT_368139 [Fusarium flagelliforme]|uniref:uncharacterized protein n=1 Tax=Fusarium flagelliforme TaxID=2675880 RepID=UPI001E8CCF29|nr:uncharacterized protein B0J16DRAFT_368139 [Fusarium flagelliforme]KAH7191816.1 hypothetical protein B0J16DRAFT_368139 [Fusarium flagelliforme]
MSNFAFPWFMDGPNMTFDVPDLQHDILPILDPSASVPNTMQPQPAFVNSRQEYLRPEEICSGYIKPCKSFPQPPESSVQMAGAEIYGHIQHIAQEASEALDVFYRSQCHGNQPGIPPRIIHAFVELYFEYFDPQFPFLHPSSVEEPNLHWILLLATAAVGSNYSEINEADSYNAILCDLLARAVEVTILEKLMKPDLVTVQSVFLLHVLWMFSGSHRDKVVLQHKRNSLATMCWDLITADGRSSMGHHPNPRQEWPDWLYSESLLRLATCIRGLECLGHLFLGTPLIFNFRDITRQLPCSDTIWQARSAQDWKKAQETPVSDTDTKSTFVSKMTLLELFIDEKNIARQLRSSQLLRSSFTNSHIIQIPDYENLQLEASIDQAALKETETLFHVLAILRRLPLEILHSATGWQASKQQMVEAKQKFGSFLQNGSKARQCLWHAASIFKTTRSSRRLACYDALSLTVAMGYIYCYLELSPPKAPSARRPAIVRLDQLHDPEEIKKWIEGGDDKIVHLTGVGLLDSDSRVRLLRDLEMTLCGQIAWRGFCRAFAASFAQLRRGETPTKESTVHVEDDE